MKKLLDARRHSRVIGGARGGAKAVCSRRALPFWEPALLHSSVYNTIASIIILIIAFMYGSSLTLMSSKSWHILSTAFFLKHGHAIILLSKRHIRANNLRKVYEEKRNEKS
jgi:uncharacterized membrane protein